MRDLEKSSLITYMKMFRRCGVRSCIEAYEHLFLRRLVNLEERCLHTFHGSELDEANCWLLLYGAASEIADYILVVLKNLTTFGRNRLK